MGLRGLMLHALQHRAHASQAEAAAAIRRTAMDPQPPYTPKSTETVNDTEPARRRISRRATILGSVIALVVVGGVGWLAWDLTHPSTPVSTAAGPGRGGGGAGGGGGG